MICIVVIIVLRFFDRLFNFFMVSVEIYGIAAVSIILWNFRETWDPFHFNFKTRFLKTHFCLFTKTQKFRRQLKTKKKPREFEPIKSYLNVSFISNIKGLQILRLNTFCSAGLKFICYQFFFPKPGCLR